MEIKGITQIRKSSFLSFENFILMESGSAHLDGWIGDPGPSVKSGNHKFLVTTSMLNSVQVVTIQWLLKTCNFQRKSQVFSNHLHAKQCRSGY